MVIPMDLLGEIFGFIGGGRIGGIPTFVFMIIPFILGLIVGFFIKKALKWAIIGGIILVILAYFGVWGLSFGRLQDWATIYGGAAIHGAILIIGILPIGIGFIVGVILGFLFG
jgi:hypothetical protein